MWPIYGTSVGWLASTLHEHNSNKKIQTLETFIGYVWVGFVNWIFTAKFSNCVYVKNWFNFESDFDIQITTGVQFSKHINAALGARFFCASKQSLIWPNWKSPGAGSHHTGQIKWNGQVEKNRGSVSMIWFARTHVTMKPTLPTNGRWPLTISTLFQVLRTNYKQTKTALRFIFQLHGVLCNCMQLEHHSYSRQWAGHFFCIC